jgi:hypothetical protein
MISAAILILSLVAAYLVQSVRRRKQEISAAAARQVAANRRLSALLNGAVAAPRLEPMHESYGQFRERKR